MLVRDCMTEHAEWIGPDTPLADAARTMREKNIGCLPIGENDRLIGMLTDRDICCRGVAEACDPRSTKAREIMSKGLVWCFDDQDILEAAQKMEEKSIHHMPVMNREKRMIGVLSLSDLARKAPQTMFGELSRLAARDALRHAATPVH